MPFAAIKNQNNQFVQEMLHILKSVNISQRIVGLCHLEKENAFVSTLMNTSIIM